MKKKIKSFLDSKCDNCLYFRYLGEADVPGLKEGECIRFPPTIQEQGERLALFPLITHNRVCGEFTPKE